MFTTFAGGPPQSSDQAYDGSASPTYPAQVRPKRSQVARACDSCRTHRIRSANIFREIERLRLRVKELEELRQPQNRRFNNNNNNNVTSTPSPPASSGTSSPLPSFKRLDPLEEHGGSKKHWEGIHTSTARSNQTQYYGPSSLFYFIGRMSSYLNVAFQQPHLDHHLQPNSASRCFSNPTSPNETTDGSTTVDYLTGTQEDYFLSLFWQSYHCILQIVDEAEFREYYKSLWTTPGMPRKHSALVDIILALCMQYGVAFMPRSRASRLPNLEQSRVDVDGNDATIAGRWLYRRCQTLLSAELESPSTMTIQCHIFSVYYLCLASFQNMAYSTLSLAVRNAQILGLHLEPPEGLARKERELRKRLWWTLYTLECKTCMKLGRPWSVEISQVTCGLPADDHELALLSGSNFASYGENITWLTYTLQITRLVLAARAVYVAFYDNCADLLHTGNPDARKEKTLYGEPQAMESCAKSLLASMHCLQDWLRELPNGLKTQRKGTGEPFSTDRSPLELELYAPTWLQRQRLILELFYHHLAVNLYRPFISFSINSGSSTPVADGLAASCVNHAMAITYIIHQVLSETDFLSGWHEAFQWQWNATLTMVGFTLAYPLTPSSASARRAIDGAVNIFENFGNNFAAAASAANVTRNLATKADFLIHQLGGDAATLQASSTSSNDIASFPTSFDSPNLRTDHNPNRSSIISPDDESLAMVHNAMADSMNLAFAIDSFNSFEPLCPDGSDTSMWNFSPD
ncbi:MAG: hypothetical protein Q9167_003521 [Letrouitia subvulpina]